ncbi:glycosyltransferase [Mucilaginibacter gilvus]|uniref:Glycosyltransferase n=2 Tax=Mucilaginibacter gilvus TaxID=2305909 RepID=A0A444MIY9_9SPHI|nr:glycosyltransferase [Mucilaginibacter gilvus]
MATQGVSLFAVELFGKGSPYTFDTVNAGNDWWSCLFPDKSADELPQEEIKKSIFFALDKIDADVIIGPSIVFYAGALGIAWAKKHGRKFVMFDDARPAQVKRNFVVQWVKNLITSQADAFWFPTKSYDSAYANFKRQGLHYFYGFACINNELFKRGQSLPPAGKTIICVARLVPIKNIDGLLAAWQIVERQDTGYRLLIVGDGPEVAKLKHQKEALKLGAVDFADAVDNNSLPAYFAQAEAFILPSFSETWGLVVNEAMAAGLPVLLSRTVNAAADLLKDGENGFGFDAFDTSNIAEAILKYIQLDDGAKTRMSVSSLAIIECMSYGKMAEQLTAALAIISAKPYKSPGLIAAAIINKWHGRYNTSGWDKL